MYPFPAEIVCAPFPSGTRICSESFIVALVTIRHILGERDPAPRSNCRHCSSCISDRSGRASDEQNASIIPGIGNGAALQGRYAQRTPKATMNTTLMTWTPVCCCKVERRLAPTVCLHEPTCLGQTAVRLPCGWRRTFHGSRCSMTSCNRKVCSESMVYLDWRVLK